MPLRKLLFKKRPTITVDKLIKAYKLYHIGGIKDQGATIKECIEMVTRNTPEVST